MRQLRCRTLVRLGVVLGGVVMAALWPVAALAYHLADPLSNGTLGNATGGSFDSSGWHVTDTHDTIWYALPRLVSGSIEFDIGGFTEADIGCEAEIVAMYEAGYGMTEPIGYNPEYRNNHYKMMLRVFGNPTSSCPCSPSDTPPCYPDPAGQQKVMWGMCASGAPGYDSCTCGNSFFAEPRCGATTWDGSAQHIRIEWGSGITRYYRNGVEQLAIDWTSAGFEFGPSELHFTLGSPRSREGLAMLPIGTQYANVVVDGVEGALATCGGGADAGPTYDAAPSDAGNGAVTVQLDPVDDTFAAPLEAAVQHGDLDTVQVGGDGNGNIGRTIYFKFDLRSISGTVVDARLHVTATNGGGGGVIAAVSNNGWTEETLTWNNRPASGGSALDQFGAVAVDSTYSWNVTSGLQGGDFRSFAVTSIDGDGAAYASKENAATASRPYLVLVYRPGVLPDAGAHVDSAVAVDTRTPVPDAATTDHAVATDAAGRDARQPDAAGRDTATRADAAGHDAAGATNCQTDRDCPTGYICKGSQCLANNIAQTGCGCASQGSTASASIALLLLAALGRRRPSRGSHG